MRHRSGITQVYRHPFIQRYWRYVLVLGLLLGTTLLVYEQTELLSTQPRWVDWRSKSNHEPSHWVTGVDDEEETVDVQARGRILITGGGGNIGKLLIRRLLTAHTPITVLDLVFHSDELYAIHHDLPQADHLLDVVYGDIRDEKIVNQALKKDVIGVIHLAAVSRVAWCLENEPDCADVNVQGTDIILSSMEKKLPNAWFIQASSREVYGVAERFPVEEDTPNNPANAYGATKADAEKVIYSHADKTSTRAILLRLSNVYGGLADHRERLIPAIMSNALSHRTIQIVGGNQNLDMIHIDDVLDGFSLAINRLETKAREGWTGVEVYNIGTGGSTRAMDLIRKVLALTNSSSPLQIIPGDARFPDHYIGGTTKAAEVLGFRARISQDEGLVRLTAAFLESTLSYLDDERSVECRPIEYSLHDLLQLDGCTGTVGVDGSSGIEYLYYDATTMTWDWKDEDEPQTWKFEVEQHQGQAKVRFDSQVVEGESYFEATEPGHILGASKEFIAKVDSNTGYVQLLFEHSGNPLIPSHITSTTSSYRLTPFCCAGKPAPYPFFKEDPLASAISDQRLETVRYFNASHKATMCHRLDKAYDIAQDKLDKLNALSRPLVLPEASLPSGQPYQWRLRELDTCSNLCDHPTICVDTGDCACALSACSSQSRFPFKAFANVKGLSYPPPTVNWDELVMYDPDILIKQVAQSSWLNVLRQPARRYLSANPQFMNINLTRLPDDVQEDRDGNPDHFNRVQSTPHGCFSADAVMERGVQAISQDYTEDGLVFMPYYAGTQMMPPVEPWIDNALSNLPPDFDSTRLIVPFTFDWGVCNTVLRNLFRVRDWSSVAPQMTRITSWQPMGDLNSPCYRIDQDVVIPARTCLQDQLRETYGDLKSIKPSRQRSILVAFKGSVAGAGTSLRQKITCDRPYGHLDSAKLVGGNSLKRYWNEYKPGSDYLTTIGDTVFCPVPRGTTGWATRTIDVIYAGCIPVLMGDQTHHPFWDLLDYQQFSIQISDSEIDHLEEILLGYTWGEIQRMQTNLILIRNAFLYPSEEDIKEKSITIIGDISTGERDPFYWAMGNTALLRLTRYPS